MAHGLAGRPRQRPHTTDDLMRLDIRRLKQHGVLVPGWSGTWGWHQGTSRASTALLEVAGRDRLLLSYRTHDNKGGWSKHSCSIELDWTPCHYGGERPWFRCPAMSCGRRVAVLYVGGPGVFACRHCHRLGYACQRERPYERALRKRGKIDSRLGWTDTSAPLIRLKPRRMHHKTFERYAALREWLSELALRYFELMHLT